MEKKTRSATALYGLGCRVTADDKSIASGKLPTHQQVLHSFLAHYAEEKKKGPVTKQRAAAATFSVVKPHYEKADIPLQPQNNCIRMVRQLYEKYLKATQNVDVKRRHKPHAVAKVEELNKLLKKTMPFWPKNAREIVIGRTMPAAVRNENITHDLAFFEKMITDRKGRYAGRDVKTQTLSKKLVDRKRKREGYYSRQRAAAASTSSRVENDEQETHLVPTHDNDEDYRHVDEECVPQKKIHLTLDRDFYKEPKLVQLMTRTHTTPTTEFSILSTIVEVSKHI